MGKNITQLLDKEVSRKEFLQFVGGGVLVIFGLNNLISYISQFNRPATSDAPVEASNGFGSRRFGA